MMILLIAFTESIVPFVVIESICKVNSKLVDNYSILSTVTSFSRYNVAFASVISGTNEISTLAPLNTKLSVFISFNAIYKEPDILNDP